MDNYKQLAMIYLKHNKKRSLITIAGVALCVTALFVIMNLTVSYIVTKREETREQIDYEAYFTCADPETAGQLAEEDCLKSARIKTEIMETGSATDSDPDDKPAYNVYVNFKNPYVLFHFADKLAKKYSVTYQVSGLATYYLQDKDDDLIYTLVLVMLLVSYIFAILGVGIVRNSIQLITLEQIRDYGILRCIGASKKQLRAFIYRMGFLLELGGIVLGTAVGFAVYLIPASRMHLRIGFHIVVLPFILIAFLGDLYFVMRENSSFVNSLTPVAAVQGAYQGRAEKFKVRKTVFIAKLFGFEGDYAFKNLLRNPSRFRKSVCSIAFGIGMVIVAFCVNRCIDQFLYGTANHYGKYQIYGYTPIEVDTDLSLETFLPSHNYLRKNLIDCRYITATKPIYCATLYPQEPRAFFRHFADEYAADSVWGQKMSAWAEKYDAAQLSSQNEKIVDIVYSKLQLYGYDEEDYRSLKSRLVAGTLELSERGILLVNHTYTLSVQTDVNGNIMRDYTVTDYRIGDTVTFADPVSLRDLTAKQLLSLNQDAAHSYREKLQLMHDCYHEIAAQNATQSFVIEGILEADSVLSYPNLDAHFILPLDRYLQVTGTAPEHAAGYMYHLHTNRLDSSTRELFFLTEDEEAEGLLSLESGGYLETLVSLTQVKDVIFWAAFFVLFVVLLNVMNILNTTSSSLHLRRKEFAQLRVLGMSEKHLQKTVLLEGVLTAIAASLLGTALGCGVTAIILHMVKLLVHVEFHFPWGIYALTILATFLLLCGSIYVNLRGMKVHPAQELTADGE